MPKYTKQVWIDRLLGGAATYNISGTGAGQTIALDQTVTIAGTKLLAAYLNNIEQGIAYASEYGARLVRSGATSYYVEAGYRNIEGSPLEWSADIAKSSLSLSINAWYYIYVYNNSGTPAVEHSTIAPAWNSTYRYWQKTGDASRRRIGSFLTDSGGNIADFLIVLTGGDKVAEFTFLDNSAHSVLSTGTSASWTSVSLSAFIPKAVTHVLLRPKIKTPAATFVGILGLSPKDISPIVGSRAPYTIRNDGGAVAAGKYFPTTYWLPMITNQTYWYIMQALSGSPEAELDAQGFRFDL